jgi:uncharacterized protein YcfJ
MIKYFLYLVLTSITVPAWAQDSARVIRSEPRYVTTHHQECHDVWMSSNNSSSGAVVGAIAGGILGNQVGEGRGRDAATVLGAIVGANVGERMGQDQQNLTSRRECRLVPVTVQRGRIVTFEYQGNLFSVTLDR